MNLLNLHSTNRICPRCKNPNYMVSLDGVSNEFQYKCINCNSYFTYDDFTPKTSTIKNDMVKVVRCKDCDNKECCGRAGNVVCGIDGTPHRPDWFCADGKRR